MLYCDWSARDVQMLEMKLGLGPAKGKDCANSFGPVYVTVDEFEGFSTDAVISQDLLAYVNERLVTHENTDVMDWDFAEIVSYASRGTVLMPGDVIGSGTVPTGCLFEEYATLPEPEFQGWLDAGDRVVMDGGKLGVITAAIQPALPLHGLSTGF